VIGEHRRTLELDAKNARARISETEREIKTLDNTRERKSDELKSLHAELAAIEGAINSLASVNAGARRGGRAAAAVVTAPARAARRRPGARKRSRRQSADQTNAMALAAAADWIDLASIAKLLGRTHGRARQVMEGLVESGQAESRLQETPRKRFYRATAR
jgi:peptidoglycan hydrolase CwlO-like protein